jgi:cell division transport system permease protein
MPSIFFFIREAAIGLRRSGLMTVLSLCTLAVSMLVLGFFLLFTVNVNNLADFFVSRLEIRVFFRDDITRRDKRDFHTVVQGFDTVREVEFVDKAVAWETLKQQYSGTQLTSYIDKNPLPDTMIIRVTDQTKIQAMVSKLETYTTVVDDIVYGGYITERIQLLSKWLRISGWGFNALLLLATLMIIVNTIRLTIMARHNEVEIMQLVGATRWFIRWPFVIEGFVLGVVGSTVSVVMLKFSYDAVAKYIQQQFPFMPLIFNSPVLWWIYAGLFIIGTVLGVMGAYISISRTLE